MYKIFDFNERADIQYLDRELNILSHLRQFGIHGIDITKCYDNYYESDRKVVYMAIDFKLHLFHLFSMIRNINYNLDRSDTEMLFSFHGNWVSFIALYRSFFDKFMNIVVYTCYKDKYKDFESSKSRNKSFRKITTEIDTIYSPTGVFMHFPKGFSDWAYNYLNEINNQYRTAEVHGDGSARKWVFQEPNINETPVRLIQEFVDHMGQFLVIACFILVGRDYGDELQEGIYKNSPN